MLNSGLRVQGFECRGWSGALQLEIIPMPGFVKGVERLLVLEEEERSCVVIGFRSHGQVC